MTMFKGKKRRDSDKSTSPATEEQETLRLTQVITSGDDVADSPEGIFLSSDTDVFTDLSKVFDRQIRDYKFFLKFQKYTPVSHFVERPERCTNVYEKKYWNLTLFNRICCSLRQKAQHLATAPFSSQGHYRTFEKEILNEPQSCPIYVERSRAIMEANLKRFEKVMIATHRDVHNEFSLSGYIPGDEYDSAIKLDRFMKKRRRSGEATVAEIDDSVPTTSIDRGAIPASISSEEAK